MKHEPEVTYEADDNSYYTLLMTDPDFPSRQNLINDEIGLLLTYQVIEFKMAS
jgi:hypothetical protein